MNLFKYISARSRLVEINKTVEAMGGEEAPSMLLAQQEMTSDEVTYFFYKTISDIIYTLLFLIILIGGYGVTDAI
jgi:hypothetical protein